MNQMILPYETIEKLLSKEVESGSILAQMFLEALKIRYKQLGGLTKEQFEVAWKRWKQDRQWMSESCNEGDFVT